MGPRSPHVAARLVAVLLAVACWAESMRRALIAAGGHLPATGGVAADGTGRLATWILPIGNAGGRDRVALPGLFYRFLLLFGGASLAVTATNVRTLSAEAVEEATLPGR